MKRRCFYCDRTLGRKQAWNKHFERFHSTQFHIEFKDLEAVSIIQEHGLKSTEAMPQESEVDIVPHHGNVVGGSLATQSTSSTTISASTVTGSSICKDVQDITLPVTSVTQAEFDLLLQDLGDQPQEGELSREEFESRFFLPSNVSISSTSVCSVYTTTLAIANSSSTPTPVSSSTVLSRVLPASVPSNPEAESGQESSLRIIFSTYLNS